MKMQFYFLKTQTHIPPHAAATTTTTILAVTTTTTAREQIQSASSWVDQRDRCPIGYEMMPSSAGRLIRQFDGTLG